MKVHRKDSEGTLKVHRHTHLNLVRQVEQHSASPWADEIAEFSPKVEADLADSDGSFAGKAIARADQLASLTGLAKAYELFAQRARKLHWLIYAAMAVLGFFAVMQTLANVSGQINVYWLLILMLGLNSVSILLWIVFALRRAQTQSPLIAAQNKLLALFAKRSDQGAFFSTWTEAHLLAAPGRWSVSKKLHWAWILYLLGGLAAMFIALTGRQYDFVWATTILSADAFVRITELLGTIPSALGFAIPTGEQVLASRLKSEPESLAALRNIWSSFIIACIVVYALIPRALLWIVSAVLLVLAQSRHEPDWEQPYFYALRARLLPESHSLGVVDADQNPSSSATSRTGLENGESETLEHLNLPDGAYVGAFEWARNSVPDVPIKNPIVLGEINDVHAQTGALQAIKQNSKPTIIFVELQRAADRGAVRFLGEITKLTELHLVIVKSRSQASDAARWAGWQSVCERIKLAADQTHLVHLL